MITNEIQCPDPIIQETPKELKNLEKIKAMNGFDNSRQESWRSEPRQREIPMRREDDIFG